MGLLDLFKNRKNNDDAVREAIEKGKDEDYTFGYTEEELEEALR